jgi:hypothetical protein
LKNFSKTKNQFKLSSEKELFFSPRFFKRKKNGEKNTREKIEKSFSVKKEFQKKRKKMKSVYLYSFCEEKFLFQ